MKKVWILHSDDDAASKDFETKKLLEAFKKEKINARVFKPKFFDIITSRKKLDSLRYDGEIVNLPDAVLVRTGAGTNYFALALMRELESLYIPVINSSQGVINSKDKMISSQVLAKAKIPTPRTMLVSFPINIDTVEQEIGFPCVVKLVTGSLGKGVYLCQDREFFKDLMELIDNLKSKKSLIIQEFVATEEIFDLRVWVIGGEAKVAMKRTPPKGDFRANISRGGHGYPFEITKDIKDICEKTAKEFDLEISGIDLLFDGKNYKVCEANSSPGFEGIDKFCKTNMSAEIVQYIRQKIN
jgi:gamma-F420-2:alpha-L-glutamate ligase